MAPPICVTVLSLFVWLCPTGAEASTMSYAVQVAALRSQQSATDLARGLRAQGINAYWVGKNGSQQGVLYRVRIGKFPSIESAFRYAEELMNSGIFSSYAIAAYEAPPAAALNALAKDDPKTDKVQAFFPTLDNLVTTAATVVPAPPPTPNASRFDPGTIDMIAAVGTRGWLLLSSQDVLALSQQNRSKFDREVAKLAAAVGSRGWMIRDNIAKSFAAPTSVPASTPTGTPVDIADLARRSSSPLPPSVLPVTEAAIPAPAPAIRANSTAISAPEIGRSPLSPTAPTTTFPGARPLNYLTPPKLQGAIEMRDGQMWMTVRNLDPNRSFTGSARVTLTNDKDQQDIAPMTVTVAPGQEESFPVTDARVLGGDWMMMVYDQGGAARLVRGASLAPKPAAPANQNAQAPAPATPPGFVTGVYDSTGGWKLSDSIMPQQQTPGANDEPPAQTPTPQDPRAAAAQAIEGGVSAQPTPQTPQDNAPVQVTVTPRQIAITSENVTMEFDIAASRPLNYIAVTIRAGEFQDTRQALMTTPQGRVPFLIPIAQTSGPFMFEVKNESGAVLASGVGDFRRLSR